MAFLQERPKITEGCEKLGQWVPSITNHFWWSIETCQGDAENLKERWLSITNHVESLYGG